MSGLLDDLDLSNTFKIVEGQLAIVDTFANRLTVSDNAGRKHSGDLTGTVVDSKYKVLSLIGEGGMGSVYRVLHLLLDKEMALKTISTAKLSPDAWARFQREAQAIGKLTHANIIQVFDFGIGDQNTPYYTMELLVGESLADRLEREETLKCDEALPIFIAVAAGLAHAHSQGIVHRDIKPANIFMEKGKGTGTPKIVDFGLAKLATSQGLDSQNLTVAGLIFGSPLYMSPEQSLGLDTDQRTDIYSFGCSLYQALTGTPPFIGKNALATISMHQEHVPPRLVESAPTISFPEGLEDIVAKLLSKDPANRYQTMTELKTVLERVAQGKSIKPLSVSVTTSKSSPAKTDRSKLPSQGDGAKRPVTVMLLAAPAIIIVVAGIALGLFRVGPFSHSQGEHSQAMRGMVKTEVSATGSKPIPKEANQPAADQSVASSIAEIKSPEWDGKPFFKGVVMHAGQRCKSWTFPESGGQRLGEVWRLGTNGGSITPESGTIYSPASDKVAFRPYSSLIYWPKLQNGLTDGNFDTLVFQQLYSNNFGPLVAALAKLKSTTGLYIYDIIEPDSAFPSKCLAAINQFPNLTKLYTTMLDDGRAVSQIKRLKMLYHLHLGNIARHSDDAFASIHGSTHLTELLLTDVPITASAAREICTCPNLERLEWHMTQNQSPIDGYQIHFLGNLKELKVLFLNPVRYSPALIDDLSKCQSLRKLTCVASNAWSQEQRTALRRALPKAELWLRWKDVNDEMLQVHYLPGQIEPARQ